jgi:hypothetical protein
MIPILHPWLIELAWRRNGREHGKRRKMRMYQRRRGGVYIVPWRWGYVGEFAR